MFNKNFTLEELNRLIKLVEFELGHLNQLPENLTTQLENEKAKYNLIIEKLKCMEKDVINGCLWVKDI